MNTQKNEWSNERTKYEQTNDRTIESVVHWCFIFYFSVYDNLTECIEKKTSDGRCPIAQTHYLSMLCASMPSTCHCPVEPNKAPWRLTTSQPSNTASRHQSHSLLMFFTLVIINMYYAKREQIANCIVWGQVFVILVSNVLTNHIIIYMQHSVKLYLYVKEDLRHSVYTCDCTSILCCRLRSMVLCELHVACWWPVLIKATHGNTQVLS